MTSGKQICFYKAFAALGSLVLLLETRSALAFKEDAVESLTSVGSAGVFVQSIEISKHFTKPVEIEGGYFLKDYWEQEPDLRPIRREILPLAWSFGAGYSYSTNPPIGTDPEIMDESYHVNFGLNWEVTPSLHIGFKGGVDSTPGESYVHGMALFRLEYTLYVKDLKKKKEKRKYDNYDPNDARQFYRREREKRLEELRKEELLRIEDLNEDEERSRQEEEIESYPNIKFIYNLGFDRHNVQPKVFRKKVRLQVVSLANDTVMYQYLNGPELIYSPNLKWSFRVALNFFRYSENVATFMALFESDITNRLAVMNNGAWSGFSHQYLSFADYSFEESIDYYLNDRESFSLNFNQTVYASSKLLYPAYAFNPFYYRDFGKKWRLGVGVNLILSESYPFTFSSSLGITFKL